MIQEAINLDPKYTKAYFRLGLIEKNLKNYDEALRNFHKVLSLEPSNKASTKEIEEILKLVGFSEPKNDKKLIDKVGKISLSDQKPTNHKKLDKNINNLTFPKLNIPLQLPNTPPQTAYQFNLYWKEFKDCKTKLDYLKSIGSKHFLKLFKKNLEPDFLSELIILFGSLEKTLVLEFLISIVEIENFDFLIMFLSKSEKEGKKF